VVDKEKELDSICNHPYIPEDHKVDLIAFLEKHLDLYSGAEFLKKHFPREAYEYDVELMQPLNELCARLFPVSGIHHEQLKEIIKELCDDEILKPGDSNFVSPVFYVMKKMGEAKTAHKGRLCFDYCRINSYVKALT
jgi:hypothetical protein